MTHVVFLRWNITKEFFYTTLYMLIDSLVRIYIHNLVLDLFALVRNWTVKNTRSKRVLTLLHDYTFKKECFILPMMNLVFEKYDTKIVEFWKWTLNIVWFLLHIVLITSESVLNNDTYKNKPYFSHPLHIHRTNRGACFIVFISNYVFFLVKEKNIISILKSFYFQLLII